MPAALIDELDHGAGAGVIQPDQVLELGEVLSSPDRGRQDDEEITSCDLTGTGAQDTAIASFALERLRWDHHA